MSAPSYLLVVGTSIDPHISAVLSRICGDVRVVRFDVDKFPIELQLTVWNKGVEHAISTIVDDCCFDVENAGVAWFRRLGQPVIPQTVPEHYRKFCLAECNHLLESALSMLTPNHWVNEYWSCRKASLKLWQYEIASRAGLRTPHTLTSNSHYEILSRWHYLKNGVAKTLSAPLVASSASFNEFAFTSKIAAQAPPSHEELRASPIQFQELIDPKFEVRVTSISGQHYGVKIVSTENESVSQTRDWRSSYSSLEYEWIEVPRSIELSLTKCMSIMNLDFAASDFIVTDSEEWYFLESNPHGAWLWLEEALGSDRITRAFAEHLTKLLSLN